MNFDIENFNSRVKRMMRKTGRTDKALSKVLFKNTKTLTKVLNGTSLSGIPTLVIAEERLSSLEAELAAREAAQ